MPGVLCHGQSTPSRPRALWTNVPAHGTFGRAVRAVRPDCGGGGWRTRAVASGAPPSAACRCRATSSQNAPDGCTREVMDRRALVLGGGGVTGIAWEIGVIAGLAGQGIDLAAAEVIIGTSAGSVVGADIACGREPEALYRAQLAPPDPEPAARIGWGLVGRLLWVMSTSRDPVRPRPAGCRAGRGRSPRRARAAGPRRYAGHRAQRAGRVAPGSSGHGRPGPGNGRGGRGPDSLAGR